MPFTGAWTPSPERYGGGEGNTDAPLLQRVYEAIARGRGTAYDQSLNPLNSVVSVENWAYARALTFDGYGYNQKLANNFLPTKTMDPGLLPRWEKILGITPYPTDTQVVRRARVVGKFSAFGKPNSIQPVIDALKAFLGSLFVSVSHQDPPNTLVWWPGLSGAGAGYGAGISAATAGTCTLQGPPNPQSGWIGQTVTLSNCSNPVNNGSFPITAFSPNITYFNNVGVAPDWGVGGSSGNPLVTWAITGPVPWASSTAHLGIQLAWVAGYYTVQSGQNVPNALFYQTIAQIQPLLDSMLPSWMTWDWFLPNQQGGGGMGFYLDEPNLDLEVFDV